MGMKFNIAFAVPRATSDERLRTMQRVCAISMPLIPKPIWVMTQARSNVPAGWRLSEEGWSGDSVVIPPRGIVSYYPKIASSDLGGIAIEEADAGDVWSIFVPAPLARSRFDLVIEAMWQLADISIPCIGGDEYSLSSVLGSAKPSIDEAASQYSSADIAITDCDGLIAGWPVIERRGNLVLARRVART